jgi:hypothetical protein
MPFYRNLAVGAEGAEATVTAAGAEPLSAVIDAVGEYQADGTPGYDVTVRLPTEWYEAVAGVHQATIEPAGDTPTGPAVPTAAVREDANGTYVLADASDETGSSSQGTQQTASADDQAGQFQPVRVTVTGQVGGYALIAPDEALPVGSRIVVSGDGAIEP